MCIYNTATLSAGAAVEPTLQGGAGDLEFSAGAWDPVSGQTWAMAALEASCIMKSQVTGRTKEPCVLTMKI
ncbi:hypothetical protein VULLAG_LOCUS21312 [Vulpes lagopus]